MYLVSFSSFNLFRFAIMAVILFDTCFDIIPFFIGYSGMSCRATEPEIQPEDIPDYTTSSCGEYTHNMIVNFKFYSNVVVL